MRRVLLLLAVVVGVTACQINTPLPKNAVILHQNIFVDEIQKGTPQTIQLPNGTVVTWKMPQRLKDGQLIKVRDIPGEPPYYIKISIIKRDDAHSKKKR